jgi:hypothetical protein
VRSAIENPLQGDFLPIHPQSLLVNVTRIRHRQAV